jgi:exosortase D (VPLPA-CTERM-specific)
MAEISETRTSKGPLGWWLSAVIALAALGVIFRDGLLFMAGRWSSEEYSHGYLIPVIALLLVWQKRAALARLEPRGAWLGTLVVLAALIIALMGELGTLYTVIQYAFLLTLFGVVLAGAGWRGMRHLWVPLLYLGFMIPLPNFLYNKLSGELQLIASELGVAFIRWFAISVFLEGNIIDLGTYKLQVVEACSGLRYLFPLMSFGFLCAYLFKGQWWQRAVLFLSTIPITILMNSLRIGVIGVLVEYKGIEMAEGFLHLFEGWVIFMACVAILFAEIWLFARMSRPRRRFLEVLRLDFPKPAPAVGPGPGASPPRPYLASVGCLLLAAVGTTFLSARSDIIPQREALVSFPMSVEDWHGRRVGLERDIVEVLQLDDWIIADYRRTSDSALVNFYVAYYDSQRKGASAHSPQSCIPGGGWRIEDFSERPIEGVLAEGLPLRVNRAVIAKGDERQLVYYWFQQRDRLLTNEYIVKWFLFWDAVTRNRTDGALLRLVTPILGYEEEGQGDLRLAEFVAAAYPHLSSYIPQ